MIRLGFILLFAVVALACSRAEPATPTPAPSPTPQTPQATPTPTFPPLPPAWPFVFNGNVTVGGEPAPDGLKVTGRIDTYRSAPVVTQGGRYLALPVGPIDTKFFDRPIVFELTRDDGKTVAAEQTLVFRGLPQPSVYELDLVFPAFP